MPRRILRDPVRGWRGWEETVNQVTQMSLVSMYATKINNGQARHKGEVTLKQIEDDQKLFEIKSQRELNGLRAEFKEMLAYKRVYAKHRFKNYDKTKNAQSETAETKDKTTGIAYPKDLKEDVESSDSDSDSDSNSDSDMRNPHARTFDGVTPRQTTELTSQPAVPVAEPSFMPVILAKPRPSIFTLPKKRDLDLISWSDIDDDTPKKLGIDVKQQLKSSLPPMTHMRHVKALYGRLYGKSSQFLRSLSCRLQIFPGDSKNTFMLKRFLKGEVDGVLNQWSPSYRRQSQIEKLKENSQLPDVISYDRTTSAIFRDFRSFQDEKKTKTRTLSLPAMELRMVRAQRPKPVRRANTLPAV
ncbi:uncharacterized protein LOC135490889 [Lineus longissimus]|uniref:uncharacterized protein LOC135490889 n=1 Tax=Lineus longissimus TaxID=88925 RepID=UPI00315DAE55